MIGDAAVGADFHPGELIESLGAPLRNLTSFEPP